MVVALKKPDAAHKGYGEDTLRKQECGKVDLWNTEMWKYWPGHPSSTNCTVSLGST